MDHRDKTEDGPPVDDVRPEGATARAHDAIVVLGADGTIRHADVALERVTGHVPEEVVGRRGQDFVHPDDSARVLGALRAAREGATDAAPVEARWRHRDGSWRWMEGLIHRPAGGPPAADAALGFRDVAERKAAEEALDRAEGLFRRAFEEAGIGLALLSPDGRHLRANRVYCEIMGYGPEELLDMAFRDVARPQDLPENRGPGRGALEDGDRTISMEKRHVRRDGSVVWVQLMVSMLRGPSGEPLYSLAQAQDITGRKRVEERLRRRSLHDALTGLPNSRLLADRLRHALERTRRSEDRKVAVLFLDLDEFKAVNDSLGHQAGDALLSAVSERLARCLRPGDTLARAGGDEFVALVEEIEDPEEAAAVARRMIGAFGAPFAVAGREVHCAASIGVALGNAPSATPGGLLRAADAAMYRAKVDGAAYRVSDREGPVETSP